MLLLNIALENLAYNVVHIINSYIRGKLEIFTKDSNIVVGSIPLAFVFNQNTITCEKLPFNDEYNFLINYII